MSIAVTSPQGFCQSGSGDLNNPTDTELIVLRGDRVQASDRNGTKRRIEANGREFLDICVGLRHWRRKIAAIALQCARTCQAMARSARGANVCYNAAVSGTA
jgi:hypothetical protein